VGRFDQVDWERVYKVLLVAARTAVRNAPDTFDCGISAEDLVGEALFAFFSSSKALGWKPGKDTLASADETQKSIERYLVGVLRHKAVDHLRRQKHVAGSLDYPHGEVAEPPAAENNLAKAEYASTRDKLYALLQADQELTDLVAATELTSGLHNVNQELADVLGRTPREVVNLKRRLHNKPGVKELLYGTKRKAEKESGQ